MFSGLHFTWCIVKFLIGGSLNYSRGRRWKLRILCGARLTNFALCAFSGYGNGGVRELSLESETLTTAMVDLEAGLSVTKRGKGQG